MVDYSRFDKIGDLEDSDDDEKANPSIISSHEEKASPSAVSSSTAGGPTTTKMTPKGKDGRLKFEYEGRTIYEWEQSLDEVYFSISSLVPFKSSISKR